MVAEVLSSKSDKFRIEYGTRTGDNPELQQGFFTRKAGPTAWGQAFRIFFEPKEDWVVESLEKMGYHVTKDNVFCPYDNIDFPFLISSEELFWWLVDYGYRLCDNEPISFKEYEERINGKPKQTESIGNSDGNDSTDAGEQEEESQL